MHNAECMGGVVILARSPRRSRRESNAEALRGGGRGEREHTGLLSPNGVREGRAARCGGLQALVPISKQRRGRRSSGVGFSPMSELLCLRSAGYFPPEEITSIPRIHKIIVTGKPKIPTQSASPMRKKNPVST